LRVIGRPRLLKLNERLGAEALREALLDARVALDLGPVLEGAINRPEVPLAPSLVPPERVADALPHVLVVGRQVPARDAVSDGAEARRRREVSDAVYGT
jgi:hypothetical protein